MVKLSREEFLRLANLRENSNDSCKNCYSWWVIDPSAGECRYLSPRMLDDDDFSAKWPVTAPDDWCGDHMEPIRKPEELGIIGKKEGPQDFNQDLTPILESLRMFLVRWKVNNSWNFEDLLYKDDVEEDDELEELYSSSSTFCNISLAICNFLIVQTNALPCNCVSST